MPEKKSYKVNNVTIGGLTRNDIKNAMLLEEQQEPFEHLLNPDTSELDIPDDALVDCLVVPNGQKYTNNVFYLQKHVRSDIKGVDHETSGRRYMEGETVEQVPYKKVKNGVAAGILRLILEEEKAEQAAIEKVKKEVRQQIALAREYLEIGPHDPLPAGWEKIVEAAKKERSKKDKEAAAQLEAKREAKKKRVESASDGG